MRKNIVIFGSGNLATHLAIALKNANHNITQIYSRNIRNAVSLSKKVNCSFTDNLRAINKTADIYFIAVSDMAISDVLQNIDLKDKLLVHTSGSTNIDIFNGITNNYGAFYPLQTFNKNWEVKFREIPLCIEANNKLSEVLLLSIANQLSDNVVLIDSEKRLQLHLAAVFVSNFVNHFYAIADKLVGEKDISFDLLKPLILKTSQNALDYKPVDCQTGPAIRNDRNIIELHSDLLKKFPLYKRIYIFVSKSIFYFHRREKGNNEKF